jgi:hypothetical protein
LPTLAVIHVSDGALDAAGRLARKRSMISASRAESALRARSAALEALHGGGEAIGRDLQAGQAGHPDVEEGDVG